MNALFSLQSTQSMPLILVPSRLRNLELLLSGVPSLSDPALVSRTGWFADTIIRSC